MSILLSVNPTLSLAICLGFKPIEWRKCPLPIGKAFIYETKRGGGCGMVIGESEVVNTLRVDPNGVIKDYLIKGGMVDREFLKRYAGGKEIFANFLVNSFAYGERVPLTEFRYRCPEPKNCLFCKYSLVDETYYDNDEEAFYDIETNPGRFDLGCHAGIDRPPQSWCYVEDLKGGDYE